MSLELRDGRRRGGLQRAGDGGGCKGAEGLRGERWREEHADWVSIDPQPVGVERTHSCGAMAAANSNALTRHANEAEARRGRQEVMERQGQELSHISRPAGASTGAHWSATV